MHGRTDSSAVKDGSCHEMSRRVEIFCASKPCTYRPNEAISVRYSCSMTSPERNNAVCCWHYTAIQKLSLVEIILTEVPGFTLSQWHLSTTHLTWTGLELNPGLRGSRPAVNCPNHGTAGTTEEYRRSDFHGLRLAHSARLLHNHVWDLPLYVSMVSTRTLCGARVQTARMVENCFLSLSDYAHAWNRLKNTFGVVWCVCVCVPNIFQCTVTSVA